MSQNAPHMLRRSIIGILSAVLFIACGLVCMPSQAFAAQSQTAASTGTQHRQVLSLSEATAVVTDTSGYHLKVTITNTDSQQWQAGQLSLNINSDYTFTSRTDMQEWAQSQNMIPAPNELGSVAVPALAPGQSTTVAINAKADNAALTSIMTWGPKPLLAVYAHDDENVELRSFLTRSSAGLAAAQTPAMQITMVAPLSSSHWQVSNEALTAMVNNPVVSNSGNGQTAADAASSGAYGKNDNAAVTLNSSHTRFDRSLSDVLSRHSALQVIADPTYLNALNMPPKVSALMQPAAFDITAYAADGSTQRYTNAGVQNSMWNAKASLAQYRNAIGDNNATIGTVAWQGKGHWTMDALTEARRHGYSAVISTADFEPSASDTVRTGTNVVTTDAALYYANQVRIHKGLWALIISTVLFLTIMFITNGSKVIFLLMWIATMFAVAAYLIAVEYLNFELKRKVEEITRREQDFGEETADIVVRQRRQRLAETITELEAATEAARTAMTQRKTVAVPNDEVDEIIDELRAEYKDESGKDGAKGASEDKA